MGITKLLQGYTNGDETCLCKIIDTFNPLIEKYSYICGIKDEDLYNEQLICLIKCLRKFKFNENHFRFSYIQNKSKMISEKNIINHNNKTIY